MRAVGNPSYYGFLETGAEIVGKPSNCNQKDSSLAADYAQELIITFIARRVSTCDITGTTTFERELPSSVSDERQNERFEFY